MKQMLAFFVVSVTIIGNVGGVAFASGSDPTEIKGVYLDLRGNVVIVKESHERITLTRRGGYEELKLANGWRTVAWIKPHKSGSSLYVYRDGAWFKINGNPYVRNFWFLESGRNIGVDTGGKLLPGNEYLYDVLKGNCIASFSQDTVAPSERPSWSKARDWIDR